MSPAVETDSVVKRYGETEALRGLSIRIEPGELYALLGPSGSGKTTWISILCGLCRPTSGTARVFGHDVSQEPMTTRRLIGLVPQEVNFDPFFSARSLLRYQMGYFGVPPDDARILELLEAFELKDKADADTRELSGGMKRRLLIVKALVHRPKVLFLDEPTAGVDLNLRRSLWHFIGELREAGTTIVLTTHYLEEAQQLADRIAIIETGRLVTVDRGAALLAQYGRRVARFTFAKPIGALPDALRDVGGVVDEARTSLRCPVVDGGLTGLFDAAKALGPVLDLSLEEPSLDQVFTTLTSRGERR